MLKAEKSVEPFARERVLAQAFGATCPALPKDRWEDLAQLLAAYREELLKTWDLALLKRSRRGL